MNRKSIYRALFIALFSLFISYSYAQLAIALGVKVKGTSNIIWDAAHNRYLFTYQDISYDVMGIPQINEASIYKCDRDGKNVSMFTQLSGDMFGPTGMVIKGDSLYVADWTKIWIIKLSDGTPIDYIPAPGLMGIQDICSDGVNTLYATDILDSKIYWFNMTTKEFDTLAVDTNGVNLPSGIYFENTPKKSLFVCSFRASSPIQRYDFSGDSIYILKRTSYRYLYDLGGDGKGNYFLSDWKSTAANAGTVYKFLGGWDVSLPFVNYLNFPAEPFYQPTGDTLVIAELNKPANALRFVQASRDLIKPQVDTVLVANDKTIIVYFNEPVNATYKNPLNYGGVGTFTSIAINSNKNEVTLSLTTALVKGFKTPFTVANIQDLAGNAMYPAYSIDLYYKPSGIDNNSLKDGISVYPNPVKNKLTIDYELLYSSKVNIELFDVMGNKVAEFYNGNQDPGKYTENYQIPDNISGNGLYILKLTVDGQIFMTKVLVNK